MEFSYTPSNQTREKGTLGATTTTAVPTAGAAEPTNTMATAPVVATAAAARIRQMVDTTAVVATATPGGTATTTAKVSTPQAA